MPQVALKRARERVHVDLEADRQRLVGGEPVADAAVRGARDGLVELQRVAPERLVTERVEAESFLAFVQSLARVLKNVGVRAALGTLSQLDLRGRAEGGQQTETRDSDQRHEEKAIGESHDDSSERAVERDSRVLDLRTKGAPRAQEETVGEAI